MSKERSIDWLLLALTVVIVALGAALGVLLLTDDDPWQGVSYLAPIAIIEYDNTIPTVDGVDIPSFYADEDTKIPARLTRVVNCADYTCPAGSFPYEVTVRWQLMDGGVPQTTQITVLEGFESALIEGLDYICGESGEYIEQLNPFGVSDEVRAYIEAEGLDVSSWRIEGRVDFLVQGVEPVAWSTQVFNLYRTTTSSDR